MLNKKLAKSLIICFLGPDGSGKSTVIELLKKESSFEEIHYFHLKPLKKDQHSPNKVVSNPHSLPLYSKTKSFFKLFFLTIQYNLGWIYNILPIKIKPSLIIFDRYFDDILVDNKRYRINSFSSFIKFFRFFIPKPDLFFILTADASIIFKRKQEVSLLELKRQVKAYRNLADNHKYINIDVNNSPSIIVEQINKLIIQKIND